MTLKDIEFIREIADRSYKHNMGGWLCDKSSYYQGALDMMLAIYEREDCALNDDEIVFFLERTKDGD